MKASKEGDRVQIHYTGRFEDGTVFDSSQGREPLEFTAGSDELIPGVSMAVIGMQPGDSKTVEVPPEQGYGQRVPDRSHKVSRDLLPQDVEVGAALMAESQEGDQPFTVWVTELDDESAVIDANHPLAGQNLIFDIELVSVE